MAVPVCAKRSSERSPQTWPAVESPWIAPGFLSVHLSRLQRAHSDWTFAVEEERIRGSKMVQRMFKDNVANTEGES